MPSSQAKNTSSILHPFHFFLYKKPTRILELIYRKLEAYYRPIACMAASWSLLLFTILLVGARLPPFTSALDISDSDVGSDESLFAVYNTWQAIHRSHGSNSNGDVVRRFNIFKENALNIHASNKRSNVGYKLRLNKFADMTVDEFRAVYTRARSGFTSMPHDGHSVEKAALAESIPESVDWRVRGAVTSVKDQGSCGKF